MDDMFLRHKSWYAARAHTLSQELPIQWWWSEQLCWDSHQWVSKQAAFFIGLEICNSWKRSWLIQKQPSKFVLEKRRSLIYEFFLYLGLYLVLFEKSKQFFVPGKWAKFNQKITRKSQQKSRNNWIINSVLNLGLVTDTYFLLGIWECFAAAVLASKLGSICH